MKRTGFVLKLTIALIPAVRLIVLILSGCTSETDTRSAVLKKLSEDKDNRYVMLENALGSMLLDSENSIWFDFDEMK